MLPALRIVTGLGLLGGVIATGWCEAPLTVIPPLAVVFTVSFGLGRWRAWRRAAQAGALPLAVLGQLGTLLAQTALVATLYLIGRGLSAVLGPATCPLDGETALAGFAGAAVALGALIAVLEARLPHGSPLVPAHLEPALGVPSPDVQAAQDGSSGIAHDRSLEADDHAVPLDFDRYDDDAP